MSTSIAFSPSLGHWLGLGLLSRGPERHGEIVRVYDPVRGGDVLVEVRPPCFIDPEGERAPCLTVRFMPSPRLPELPFPAASARKGASPAWSIEERAGLGLATVAARKGQADALKRAVASAYGVELPDSSHIAGRSLGELRRLRARAMARGVGNSRRRGARPRSRAKTCAGSPRSPIRAGAGRCCV